MSDLREKEIVEDPAVALLTTHLGWTELHHKEAEAMRGSRSEVVLYPVLRDAIRRLNPWITDENVEQVVRKITKIPATSLLDANEKAYEILQRGTSIRQDFDDDQGLRSRDVRLIDYAHPDENVYHVVRQLRIQTVKENIPDLVLFINGLPIAVIECKSPDIAKPIEEGLKQIFRYLECRDQFRRQGCPQLFPTVQVIAVLTRDQAKYGTVSTPGRHWSDWLDTYPLSSDQVTAMLGHEPGPMETFLVGIFRCETLLDLVENFIVFEKTAGRTLKKLAKYMQFRAVNRILRRVLEPHPNQTRGGIIMHWQGSGKSLTMLWAAFKLRQQAVLANPTLLIVTDRTDLDDQIFATFQNAGFPTPVQAKNAKHLLKELSHPVGQTIMTTVQKFQKSVADGVEITPEHAVFVLTDEAHVTQYGKLADNMRAALPHATFFAFTGTPIAKAKRNTVKWFGPVIDRYDHIQSARDGVTVPICYIGLLPELHLIGDDIDTDFTRILRDAPEEERERVKQKTVTRATIATISTRIRAISRNIIKHYETAIEPNGFKGQIVTSSREAAFAYYQAIRDLNGPSCEVLYTTLHNEETPLAEQVHTSGEEKEIIRRFKEEADPKLLIVCDKLLKGFDAPVEQVMYLDRPLREHTLLQAIGRVNRRMEKKTYGLVVDYWGVLGELKEALEQYGTDLAAGMVELNFHEQVIARTGEAMEAALRFFGPGQQFDDPVYDDRCVRDLKDEERRIRFNRLFKDFADLMDQLIPDPASRQFDTQLTWLARIRRRALNQYADKSLDFSDYGRKVQKLIADHLVCEGITTLNEPVSIYSPEFTELVDRQPTREARASFLEHRIAAEITVKTEKDPIFYESLRDRLNRIITLTREKRMEEQRTLDELTTLLDDVKNPRAHGEQLGIDPEVAPYYALIQRSLSGEIETPLIAGVAEPGVHYQAGTDLRPVAEEVYDTLREHTVIGWQTKFDAQREMRKAIKAVLREHRVPVPDMEGLVARLVDLARGRAAS